MKRLRCFITVFGCIRTEDVVLFGNFAELPDDILLPYVLRTTIRDMHYIPLTVMLGVITYSVSVIVFRIILLENVLIPYLLESKLHSSSFLLLLLNHWLDKSAL
jgi:hypothetical protein